jgi:predicted nucleic acid-binding protein
MTFLVDANVLSEATRPEPYSGVLEWLTRHEREIAQRRPNRYRRAAYPIGKS